MKIKLLNTLTGLKPLYDEDYEKKKSLKLGEAYVASIKTFRNLEFHRKYFTLINITWELLGEKAHLFFKNNIKAFRHSIEITAGSYELAYSFTRKEWIESHKSIAFDNMEQHEFEELYERVKDIIWGMLEERNLLTKDVFERYLSNY